MYGFSNKVEYGSTGDKPRMFAAVEEERRTYDREIISLPEEGASIAFDKSHPPNGGRDLPSASLIPGGSPDPLFIMEEF